MQRDEPMKRRFHRREATPGAHMILSKRMANHKPHNMICELVDNALDAGPSGALGLNRLDARRSASRPSCEPSSRRRRTDTRACSPPLGPSEGETRTVAGHARQSTPSSSINSRTAATASCFRVAASPSGFAC